MAHTNVNDAINGGGMIQYALYNLETATAATVGAVGACKLHWVYAFSQGNDGFIDFYDSLSVGTQGDGYAILGVSGGDTEMFDLRRTPIQFTTGISVRASGGGAGTCFVFYYSVD